MISPPQKKKIPECTWYLPENAQILHDNCPKKFSRFFFFRGGGTCPRPPPFASPSPRPMLHCTLQMNSVTSAIILWWCSAAGRVWKVLLDPVSDSRPYSITAKLSLSPTHIIRLRDVLFGDVWLCVGQNKLHHSVAKVRLLTASFTTTRAAQQGWCCFQQCLWLCLDVCLFGCLSTP